MKRSLQLFFGGLGAILFVSCAPTTPQSRVDRNPQLFADLSQNDKDQVLKGQLAEGMSKDAVFLAWGDPAQRMEGRKEGKSMERWDYAGTRPVYTGGVYGGYGSGPWRYGSYHGVGFGLGPEVTYLPYRRASVWFVGDQVDSWERLP